MKPCHRARVPGQVLQHWCFRPPSERCLPGSAPRCCCAHVRIFLKTQAVKGLPLPALAGACSLQQQHGQV